MLKAFFKDSSIYTVPLVLTYGINFFLLPLYTRILSPADYGILDLLKLFEALVFLTVAFEVVQGHGRYYMDEKNPANKVSYASTALIFTIFCFSCFLILSQSFAYVTSKILFGVEGLEDVFRLGSLYISVGGVLLFVNTQFRYELRAKHYAFVSFATFASTAFFSVFFAYFLEFKLRGMVVALLIGNASGLLLGFWLLKSSFRLTFDFRKLKEMLVFSIPLVPAAAAVFVSGYVDRLMINHFFSLQEVGLYGMGFRIAAIVSLLLVGFSRALTPLIITHYREKETPKSIETIFRFFVLFGLFFFVGLTSFSKEILWLLTTPSYYDASKIVIYLVPAILFSQMYMFAPGTGIAKKTIYLMWITFAISIINPIFNWFLIPHFGIKGAAMATLFAHILGFITHVVVSQRYYRIPYNWISLITAMSLAVPLAVIGQSLRLGEVDHLIFKFILLGLLAVICYWTKLISKQEILFGLEQVKFLFRKKS